MKATVKTIGKHAGLNPLKDTIKVIANSAFDPSGVGK